MYVNIGHFLHFYRIVGYFQNFDLLAAGLDGTFIRVPHNLYKINVLLSIWIY